MMDRIIIAIDPGAGGAIVWQSLAGKVQSKNMPDTLGSLWEMLHVFTLGESTPLCVIEKVGAYMPGNSGPSAVNFAEHVGALKMALIAAGIEHYLITPQKWMKEFVGKINYPDSLSLKDLKGEEKARVNARRKTYRKNILKAEAERRFPGLKVTLNNSDALGLLSYALTFYEQKSTAHKPCPSSVSSSAKEQLGLSL